MGWGSREVLVNTETHGKLLLKPTWYLFPGKWLYRAGIQQQGLV